MGQAGWKPAQGSIDMSWRHAAGIVAVIAFAPGVEAAAEQPADLKARADALIQGAFPADGPGIAAIITRGGRTIYATGRGMADVGASRAITPETVFSLASVSKQFTAAVILQLVDEGKMALDDPVTRYFPDYPQPAGSATVHQLLNHTSGIQGFSDWSPKNNRPHTTAEMIALFRDLPPKAPPGQTWAYNNSGYVLLGAIVEKVTGKSWHQAIEERIARPLGLRTLGYGLERETGNFARRYNRSSGAVQPAPRLEILHADGGLLGSASDLAKWAHALHHGRVVKPAMYKAMIAPAQLAGGRTHPYGMGLELEELRGRPVIGHGGSILGSVADTIYIPSEDVFVAVFANSNPPPGGGIGKRLAALAIGDPFPVFSRAELDPETLTPLFGVYRVGEAGATRRFFSRDGKLYTMREGAKEMEVFPAGGDRFFYGPNILTWFRIERRPDGNHVMEMHLNGDKKAERAVRTGEMAPPVTVDRATLQSYVGRYATEGPTVTIAMGEDGVLAVQLGQQPPRPIRPASQTEFGVVGLEARIVFHPEGGAVNRLVIHRGSNQIEARRAP
jgi:D-alanyl-D-alanine carboxypeptidase